MDPLAVFIACFIRIKYAFMSLYVHLNKLSKQIKAHKPNQVSMDHGLFWA